ncbi:hypothetical protein J3E68DRAFT_407316 [Trichoderma sp. SZMC 28012]
MVRIEKNGIGGYGEAPWCSKCCLPRSRCRQWNKRDGEGEKDGDDREWRERSDSEECVFPGVVINTVSAMLAFELPSGVTLKQKVEQWWESSRTRFNEDLGLSGWLLSPMLWDGRQMMTMVRVFHQMDIAVEEMWIQNAIEQRRVELSALSLQQWVDRETLDNCMPVVRGSWQESTTLSRDQGMPEMKIETADDECIKDILEYDEYEMERHWGSGGDEFYWELVQNRIREWGQGRIQCQLCRAYEWSEMCYNHAAGECTSWDESEEFRGLVEKLSSVKGRGRRGEDGSKIKDEDEDEDEDYEKWLTSRDTCQGKCRFPRSVCIPMLEEEIIAGTKSDEWGGCRGTEVMIQTVAALLVIANGRLGRMVVNEAMKESKEARWNSRWDSVIEKWEGGQMKYMELPREWMEEQLPTGIPRILSIFIRLTGGFIFLRI